MRPSSIRSRRWRRRRQLRLPSPVFPKRKATMRLTFLHPWFLLLLLLLPVAAWWRGREGKPAAFVYSSVQLVSGVANIGRSGAARVLAALRWLTLALCIIGLARPQFVE